MSSFPKTIPSDYEKLNNRLLYQQRVMMYLAASLAQDETCTDFGIISNHEAYEGVDVDDIVLHINFRNCKEINTVFVSVKLAERDVKIINVNYEAYVPYERILRELHEKVQFFCIFTNANNVDPKPNEYKLSNHRLRFMDAAQQNVYQQLDHTISDKHRYFFDRSKLYIMTGQPDHNDIISVLGKTLGEKYFTPKNVNELKRKIEIYMTQEHRVVPLTKNKFHNLCFEVIVDDWILKDFSNIGNIDIRYIELWRKIFSSEHKVICIHDYVKVVSLLVRFYQLHIHTGSSLLDLVFCLWEEGILPLAIQNKHRDDFLDFLQFYYRHLKNKFLIFGDDYEHPDMAVLTNLSQLSNETLEDILKIKVSLQGRARVQLSDIGPLPLRDITISRLLSWTESGNYNIIGNVIIKPEDNYRKRMFFIKEDNRNVHNSENSRFRRRATDECLDEYLLEHITQDIIIVEAESGKGKTEFLRSLAYTYNPTRVVVFINLGTCNKDMENDLIGPDGLTYFLNKVNPTSDQLITSTFYQDGAVRTLFLDDYHKILRIHRNKMKCLLEETLSRNNIRLFITTNDYNELKRDLPRAHRKMILNFLPITDEDRPPQLDKDRWTSLHFAAESGQIIIVKKLLAEKFDTTLETDEYGWTPLHCAAKNGHLEIIELLVTKNIDVDKQTVEGITALMLASTCGHILVVNFLLRNGADPSQADEDKKIALHYAAENGHLDIVELFVTKNIDVDKQSLEGITALMLASACGHIRVVNFLLTNGAHPLQADEDGMIALHYAAENGRLNIVEQLLKESSKPVEVINQKTLDGFTAITLASAYGYVYVVNFLLENGGDASQPNVDEWYPLHFAAQNGHLDIVQSLATANIDITQRNLDGDTAFTLASASGHIDIVDFLFDNSTDPLQSNRYGYTALHLAAEHGHLDIVQALLHKGIDINLKTNDECTAITLASACGHVDLVDFLLRKEANPFLSNRHGENSINIAAQNGHVKVLDLLSRKGIDVTHKSSGAIIKASEYGRTDVIEYLLEKGATPSCARRDDD